MKKYLIINTGSASKKYALFHDEEELLRLHFEAEAGGIIATATTKSGDEKLLVTPEQYKLSIAYLLEYLKQKQLIADTAEIDGIGVRIVSPGNYFLVNKVIDDDFVRKLGEARQEAPLHITPIIEELEHLKAALPNVPMAGISDSAFHADMPSNARLYSLPRATAEQYQLYRYGYHGISCRSVLSKLQLMLGSIPPRVIICHLGNGSSITAVKYGQSFDTSMGFTPLEGLPMGTRIGNIDAGAVIYLTQKMNISPADLESFFNHQCGLLGLSGITGDVRELLEHEKAGDKNAASGLENFVYHIQKTIGAYTAVLGGLDILVFTATIGERSLIMRSRICEGLAGMGISLDAAKNLQTICMDALIQTDGAKTQIAVITSGEMSELAKETHSLLG